MIRVRGIGRLARASGGAGAPLLALFWARARLPSLVDQWVALHPAKQSPYIAWKIPEWEVTLCKVQPLTWFLLVLVVAVASLAFSGLESLLERKRRTRALACALGLCTLAASIVVAWKTSPFLGKLALSASLPLTLLLGVRGEPIRGRMSRVSPGTGRTIVVAVESVALGWALWLTVWTDRQLLAVLFATVLSATAIVRATKLLGAPGGAQALDRLALAGSPMLPLPLLGLMRNPSPWWLVMSAASCALIARALERSRRENSARVGSAARLLQGVGAPLSLVAIAMVPLRFRELPEINHRDHEALHLGWLNSMSFGKWMMADAGFVYGPLREYFLAALSSVGGFTLEHVREAQVIECLGGAALLLYAGWRVSHGRPWLQLVWALVILQFTPLSNIVDYGGTISFGWTNVLRTGIPCVAMVGAIEVATGSVGALSARARRALVGWGALSGVALIYSQDFGTCAFCAVAAAMVADCLVRRGVGSAAVRAKRGVQLLGAWAIGASGVLVATFLAYASTGRGVLLLQRLLWTLLAGSWFGRPFPLHAASFESADGLLAIAEIRWPSFVYGVPMLVMLVTTALLARMLVRRAWNARSTLLLTLVLFSATCILPVLINANIDHVHSDGTGTLLLLFVLLNGLVEAPWRIGRRAFHLGAIVAAAVAYVWMNLGGTWSQLEQKFRAVAAGSEVPSTGEPHLYPDVPRAGDVVFPADLLELVRYIDRNTTERDPVWVITGGLKSGELSFAMRRHNPTPFDTQQEQISPENQAEVLRSLQDSPPVYIVGDYFDACSAEARAYVAAHWKPVVVPGYVGPVLRYVPPP